MTEDLQQLEQELQELSKEIALIKREFNKLPEGLKKEELLRLFKVKQWQALFYMEKIANLTEQQSLDCTR